MLRPLVHCGSILAWLQGAVALLIVPDQLEYRLLPRVGTSLRRAKDKNPALYFGAAH